MLASSTALPEGEDWAFEVKWDGARVQVNSDGKTLTLRSRSGRSCGDEFPEIQMLLESLRGRRVVLDGELVCLGLDGMPDFAALRTRLTGGARRSRSGARELKPATLMIFDILHCDGRAVRRLPYVERRQLLAEIDLGQGPGWRTPRIFLAQKVRLLSPPRGSGTWKVSWRNGYTLRTPKEGGPRRGSSTSIAAASGSSSPAGAGGPASCPSSCWHVAKQGPSRRRARRALALTPIVERPS
jgi:hypothetical protein